MSNLLMNSYVLLAIIVAFAVGVVMAYAVGLPYLAKKGVNVEAYAAKVEEVGTQVNNVVTGVEKIAPNTPGLSFAQKAIGYAITGAAFAEKLCKLSQIPKDQRKPEALQFVYDALKLDGIQVTDEMARIIDGAMEAAVLTLPKSNIPDPQPAPDAVQNQSLDDSKEEPTIQPVDSETISNETKVIDNSNESNVVEGSVSNAVTQ